MTGQSELISWTELNFWIADKPSLIDSQQMIGLERKPTYFCCMQMKRRNVAGGDLCFATTLYLDCRSWGEDCSPPIRRRVIPVSPAQLAFYLVTMRRELTLATIAKYFAKPQAS